MYLITILKIYFTRLYIIYINILILNIIQTLPNQNIYFQMKIPRSKLNIIQPTVEVSTLPNLKMLLNVETFIECPMIVHKTKLKCNLFIADCLITYDNYL